MEKDLEKQLHDLVIKRQTIIIEKQKVSNEISYIEAKLLIKAPNVEFNKKQLSIKKAKYQRIITELELLTKKFKLLCSKLRIVKIKLNKDNYLIKKSVGNKNLDKAINTFDFYGCVESGEIFEGPSISEGEVPTTNLDRFELTVKTYRKIISNK